MGPRHDIPSRVQAEEKQCQRDHQSCCAEKVDPAYPRHVMLPHRNLNCEGDQDPRKDNERDLDQERPTPPPVIVDPTAEHTTETATQAVAHVAEALPDPTTAKGDQVGSDKRPDGEEAPSAHPGNNSADDHGGFRLRQAADQIADAEKHVGEDEASAAPEDVGEASRQRLQRRIGDEIGRRKP